MCVTNRPQTGIDTILPSAPSKLSVKTTFVTPSAFFGSDAKDDRSRYFFAVQIPMNSIRIEIFDTIGGVNMVTVNKVGKFGTQYDLLDFIHFDLKCNHNVVSHAFGRA